MTVTKLPMPGVRDRKRGEGGGRGGVQRPPPREQHQRSENGYGGGVGELQGRCSANGSQAAGLASAIMQPLPLASRSAGAAKHASSSSALGSNWIRRFLSSTAGELGHEVAPPKSVWGGGVAAGGGGAARKAGSQLPDESPLLLAAAAPDEHKELQQQGAGMAKGWMGLDVRREMSSKVFGNGEESTRKGKATTLETGQPRPETTNTASHDFGENGARGGSVRKVGTFLCHRPGSLATDRGSRLQQQQQDGGNQRTVLFSRGGLYGNDASGPLVRGFGPLRVMRPPPPRQYATKVVGAGRSGFNKLEGTEGEYRTEADAQPDGHRLSSAATSLLDRKPCGGTQSMASPQPGTKFTPPFSTSELLSSQGSGRPFPAVEFSGAWGFRRPKKQEAEPNGGRPFLVPPDNGARDTTAGVSSASLQPAESAARFNPFGEGSLKQRIVETGADKGLEYESGGGLGRIKIGSSNKISDRFVANCPITTLGRKEDGGEANESIFHSHAVEEVNARLNSGAAGVDYRKMKEVVGFGGGPSRRHTETGPSQPQHFSEIPPFGSHLQFEGDLCIGKVGHPLPFSPHSSFPGEDNSGDDTKKSPLANLFSAPKTYEDGLDSRAAPSEQQQAPWTSLFAAFKDEKHPEPANSFSSTPTLRPDVHSRLQDGAVPASNPFEGSKVSGVPMETGGGGRVAREDAYHLPASPEARSRFDNQSSHYSNSPWPDDEGHIPKDDAGSGPSNSQAAGSAYLSQASRVANRSPSESKGKCKGTYRYDTGGIREGFDTPARSRDSSASELDLRRGAGRQGEDVGHRLSNEANQAHVSSTPLRRSPTSATSGHNDDTSDSSPPSYPLAFNISEVGSQVLPRVIVNEHLLSSAGKLKKVVGESEMEGSRVPRMEKGYRREVGGDLPKGHYDNEAVFRDPKHHVSAFLSKDPDWAGTQSTPRESDREGSRHGLEPQERHGKLRMSGEAMGEGGISGPSKRTRHHPNLGGSGQSRGSGIASPVVPSSWLKRWLPPSPANAAKSPAGFARPKDNPRNGLTSEPGRTNGISNFMGSARGKEMEKGSDLRGRNGVKDIPGKRRPNGLPPYPVPSATAMALAGTASRAKIGPFHQQRKGPVAMWPPVHVQAVQAPEAQRSSQSPELSL